MKIISILIYYPENLQFFCTRTKLAIALFIIFCPTSISTRLTEGPGNSALKSFNTVASLCQLQFLIAKAILCYANFKTSVMTIRFVSITNRQTWLAFRLGLGALYQLPGDGGISSAATSRRAQKQKKLCSHLRFAFQFQFRARRHF